MAINPRKMLNKYSAQSLGSIGVGLGCYLVLHTYMSSSTNNCGLTDYYSKAGIEYNLICLVTV